MTVKGSRNVRKPVKSRPHSALAVKVKEKHDKQDRQADR
jgi:hypothetical protein